MFCVIYLNQKLLVGEISDRDESRYLISIADADSYDSHEEYFPPDCAPSDQYQTPRFLVWKGIDQVTVYANRDECVNHINKLQNLT